MIEAKNAKAVRKAYLAAQPLKMVLLRIIGEEQDMIQRDARGTATGWARIGATREVYNCCSTYQEDGSDEVEVTTTNAKLSKYLNQLARSAPGLVKIKYSTATGWAAGYIVKADIWNEFVASHIEADLSDSKEGGGENVREA